MQFHSHKAYEEEGTEHRIWKTPLLGHGTHRVLGRGPGTRRDTHAVAQLRRGSWSWSQGWSNTIGVRGEEMRLKLSEWFPDIVSLSGLVEWQTRAMNPPLSDTASTGEARGSMGIPSLATKSWSKKLASALKSTKGTREPHTIVARRQNPLFDLLRWEVRLIRLPSLTGEPTLLVYADKP